MSPHTSRRPPHTVVVVVSSSSPSSCIYRHTYIDLLSERARLAPPWLLRSSHLNTASVYYLPDLSSFSLSFINFFFTNSAFSILSFLCFLIFVVPSLSYVKPAANNLLGFCPNLYKLCVLVCGWHLTLSPVTGRRPDYNYLIPFLVWISV